MFRTADAAGVTKIILSGYTPGPTDPRGKLRKPFIKVSLGAEQSVPFERMRTFERAATQAKKAGYTIVGVEQHARAISVFDYKPNTTKLAVVMGNEVRGLSAQSAKRCDVLVDLPMRGTKESLNVGVACGIALYILNYLCARTA